MSVRDIIIREFHETLAQIGGQLIDSLTDESILLETGLDSLGFAILVTRLEQVFGKDPFTIMQTPFYPRTFQQFVEIYEKYVA